MKPITVNELIEYLKQFDGNLPVVFELHSEYLLLQLDDIRVKRLHPARSDGWVHDFWRPKDEEAKMKVDYLVFPGN